MPQKPGVQKAWGLRIRHFRVRSQVTHLIPRPSVTGVWEWDQQSGNETKSLLVTLIFLSLIESLKSGRDSRETIQVCPSTWAAVHRCMGSTCNMRRTRSLAEGEIESQLPPERLILPSPIRDKICWGVSSGPVAKGVQLKEEGSQCIMLGQLRSINGFHLSRGTSWGQPCKRVSITADLLLWSLSLSFVEVNFFSPFLHCKLTPPVALQMCTLNHMKTASPNIVHTDWVHAHNHAAHCHCTYCVMVRTVARPTLLAWCRGAHPDSRYRWQRHSLASSIPEEYETKIIGTTWEGMIVWGRTPCIILFEYRMTKYGIGRAVGSGTQTHSLATVVSLLLCTFVNPLLSQSHSETISEKYWGSGNETIFQTLSNTS